jgi:ComF family protein
LSGLRAPFTYKEGARRLVLAFKFHGLSALAPVLAEPMAGLAAELDAAADAVVPVPLTGWRERARGFNQARLLAREVGRRLETPVAEPLRRVHSRRLQSESTREQRFHNVVGAFALRAGVSVAGQRLILVDDVATTCATVDACARVLLEAGAAEVAALTFARED